MLEIIRRKAFDIFHETSERDALPRMINFALFALIALNACAVVLETEPSISVPFRKGFRLFEIISVAVFTIEYFLRIWSCNKADQLKFAFSFFMIIDLLSILPFYVPFLIPVDLRMLRILRLFRIFRVLKLVRYSKALSIIGNVFKSKKEELSITAFAFFLLWLVSSCMIYHAENGMQPEVFSSIPAAMWWSIVTLTTVGYGDAIPITFLGKSIGFFVTISGIAFFALPTAIIGSGFMEELNKPQKQKCPHCGKEM